MYICAAQKAYTQIKITKRCVYVPQILRRKLQTNYRPIMFQMRLRNP